MKIQRFLLINLSVINNRIKIIEKTLLNQILNVFRMKVGSSFVLLDGFGMEYLVEVSEILSKKEIICSIKEEKMGIKRNKRLTLIFSMLKKENMELVVQKCTEIGVTNFIPVITDRTVKTGWNFERMRKIMQEAVEQSGFSDEPVLAKEPKKLDKVLEDLRDNRENLDGLCVFDLGGVPLVSLKHLISVDTVIIGPEGGFSQKDKEVFAKYNIKTVSFGEQTLRAETACIVASTTFLL